MGAHTQTREPLFGGSALQQSAPTIAGSHRQRGETPTKPERRCGKSARDAAPTREREGGGGGAGREEMMRRHREAEGDDREDGGR